MIEKQNYDEVQFVAAIHAEVANDPNMHAWLMKCCSRDTADDTHQMWIGNLGFCMLFKLEDSNGSPLNNFHEGTILDKGAVRGQIYIRPGVRSDFRKLSTKSRRLKYTIECALSNVKFVKDKIDIKQYSVDPTSGKTESFPIMLHFNVSTARRDFTHIEPKKPREGLAWRRIAAAVATSGLTGVDLQHRGKPVETAKVTEGGLEKIVRDRLPALDFTVFREKMAVVEGQVCRVELDGNAAGTGFLVGPDAVLTNYHVLRSVLEGTAMAAKVMCRFDYKVLADGSRVEGIVVGLHATDWRLDASPNSPAELTNVPDNPPPKPDELDYALVRLARRVGEEPAAPKAGTESPRRGWLTLPVLAPAFVPKMPLMIVQYPDGKPLKLAVDTDSVIGVNAGGTRVRYATNTDPGSSGSPVFDLDWKPVALHHLGDPAYDHPPAYNQGIPLDKVRARLTRTAVAASALG